MNYGTSFPIPISSEYRQQYYSKPVHPFSNTGFNQQRTHKSLKNVRRVESHNILNDYRQGSKPTTTGIYPTINKLTGEEALKKTRERVQESLRKRGYYINGQTVPVSSKPKAYTALERQQQQAARLSSGVPAKVERAREPFKVISNAAKAPSKRSNKAAPISTKNQKKVWQSNYHSDYPNWKDFKYQMETVRKQAAEEKELKKKQKETMSKKCENILSNESVKKIPVGPNVDLDKRNLMEGMKKVYKEENKENPPRIDMSKIGTQATDDYRPVKFNYETTNTSTYKSWPQSAFQTRDSRRADRPIWANTSIPNSGHFVRHPEKHKMPGSKNMNITLCINGKSAKRNNMGRENNASKPNYNKSSLYQTTYQKSFHN